MTLVIASGSYTRFSITRNREIEQRAKRLAGIVFDRLASQGMLHAQDPQTFPESYISMGNLRDDILRNEFSASNKQKLWKRVQKKVEQNSNVRPMVREARNGNVGRVWEWVGAVQALEDVSSAKSIRNGRVSLAGRSPLQDVATPNGVQQLDWQENRPIY